MRKFTSLTLLITILFGFNVFAQSSSASDYKYTVDLNVVENDEIKVVLITPEIKSKTVKFNFPSIVPGTYSINDYGQYVSRFAAFDKKGKALKFERLNDNTWEIQKSHKLHSIEYWVEDTWDTEKEQPYPMGGSNIEEGTNFVLNTHCFFGYFDEMKENPYQVEMLYPDGFYGSTGLIPVSSGNGKDVFKTSNYNRLVDAPMMYCKPDFTVVKVGNTDVLVSVYSPSNLIKSDELSKGIEELLMAQKEYLGGELPVEKYAFIFYFTDAQTNMFGALEHSYSSFYFLPEISGEAANQLVRDVAAHEFFHIVTPLNLHSEEIHNFDFNQPKLSQHLWLYEGVTEYSAGHVQVKYDLISERQYLDMLEEKIVAAATMYNDKLPFTKMSVLAAGEHEDQYGNVYQKGALIGMCLDVLLLDLSDGEYNLQKLVRDLTKKYGQEKPFQDENLFKVIEELTYPEIGKFLDKHVGGPTPLPYKKIFAKAGVKYVPEKDVENFSFGNIALGFNPETNRLVVRGLENLNDFGEELNYKIGDEISSVNNIPVPGMAGLRTYADDVKKKMKVGEPFKINIFRPDADGEYEEMTLETTTRKVKSKAKHKLEMEEDLKPKQAKIQKAWLKAKDMGELKKFRPIQANPEDVKSIDAIIDAMYDVISGPAGPRDWNRMRSLFKDGATMNTVEMDQDGQQVYTAMKVEDYIERSGPIFQQVNFTESAIKNNVQIFENMANVFSSYVIKISGPMEMQQEGINSIQLLKDQGRWYITHLQWMGLEPGEKLPAEWR